MIITPEIEAIFRAAGWQPDRLCPLSDWIPANHPAATIVTQLSGLRIGPLLGNDPLIEFGSEALYDSTIPAWEQALQTRMIIIGRAFNGHSDLCMDAKGRLFSNSVVHAAFSFVGPTFADGMTAILAGVRMRPMLLPDEETVTLYGEVFRQGDPAIVTVADLR